MPGPHPIELRTQVTDAWRSGRFSWCQLVARFGVSRSTVSRWLRRERRGHVVVLAPRFVPRQPALTPDDLEILRALLVLHPGASHARLAIALRAVTGRAVSRSTVSRAVARERDGHVRRAERSGDSDDGRSGSYDTRRERRSI
jgi:transposase